MDNEVYRDLTHREVIDLVARKACDSGHRAYTEFRLPHGKIADVLIETCNGNLEIIEVKMQWRDGLASEAYAKYWHYCHRLWVAVPGLEMTPGEIGPWPNRWRGNADRLGIIGVNRDNIRWLRQAEPHPVNSQFQAEMLKLISRSSRPVS